MLENVLSFFLFFLKLIDTPCLFFYFYLKIFVFFFLFIWLLGVLVAKCQIFSFNVQTLRCNMQDVVPWPVIEPGSPVLGAQVLTHQTTREDPANVS